MKNIFIKFSADIFFLFLFQISFSQTIVDSDFISGKDTLKVESSPYLSTSNIIIYQDATLVIENGVEWLFNPGVGLRVLGTIETIGDSLRPTKFSSSNPFRS